MKEKSISLERKKKLLQEVQVAPVIPPPKKAPFVVRQDTFKNRTIQKRISEGISEDPYAIEKKSSSVEEKSSSGPKSIKGELDDIFE